MKRRLLLVADGLLLVAAVVLAVRLYQAGTARPPSLPPEPAPAVQRDAPAPPGAVKTRPPLTTYGAVAERNLFSPTRTETPPEPPRPAGAAAPAPPAPKPRLYGIVLLPEGRGRAYLEDAQRRRVLAYSVGDLVGDARLEQIKGDRVVLKRGGETFEVLLHDPTKPRPAAPPPSVQSPEAGGAGRAPEAGGVGRAPEAGGVGRPPAVRAPTRVPPQPGRTPGRQRSPTPPPPPPSAEGQETDDEE